MEIDKTEEKTNIIIGCLAIVGCVFSAVMLGHMDLYVITLWGKQLLESVGQGTVYDYQYQLQELGYATNYSLFFNIISAIWLLPVYITSRFVTDLPIAFYYTWYKILLVIVNIRVAVIIAKLCDEKKTIANGNLAGVLYLISCPVYILSLGMGQIDCISVYFMMLALQSCKREKFIQGGILFGFAALIKPFVIFAFAPIIIYQLFHGIKNSIQLVFSAVTVYALNTIATKCFVRDYDMGSVTWNKEAFIPRLFMVKAGNVPIYPIVVGIITVGCFWMALKKKWDERYFILFILFYFISFEIFVPQNIQWFLYMLPFMILALGYIKKAGCAYIAMALFETGLIAYAATSGFKESLMGLANYGILSNFIPRGDDSLQDYILSAVPNMVSYSFLTIVIGLSLFVILYVQSCRGQKSLVEFKPGKIYLVFMWLILIIYEIALLVFFVGR